MIALSLFSTPVSAADPAALSPREKGDLAIRARSILRKHCSECHGGAAQHGTISVLEHAKLVADGPHPVPFVAPGKADASQIIQFVEDGSMPPGARPRVPADDIAALKSWVAAAAPSYPVAFDERTTLDGMLRDLDRHAADAAHLRYVSFAHLVREDASPPDLKAEDGKLLRALTWCGIRTHPVPVDDTATLFRLDIRQAGWDDRELFYRVTKGAAGDIHPLSPYDLILLEYPHAARADPGDTRVARLDEYARLARHARPVPFVRGDWLAQKLAKDGPLADDLRSLTDLHEVLKKQEFPPLGKERDAPCGPATRPFAGLDKVPAAARPDAVRPVLPLSAWYAGDTHADPAPFAIKVEAISAAGDAIATVVKGTPFRLRVTADRDVHFQVLTVLPDGDVRALPTNKGGFLKSGVSLLSPKDAAAFRIVDVLTGGPRATEYFVILASPTEIPVPTVVRSRHARTQQCDEKGRYPVSRFAFDPDAKFDPARVVRRVVPIIVTDQ